MSRADEITAVLKDIKPKIELLNGWLAQENMGYEMVKADLTFFQQKKQELISEIAIVERQIADKKKETIGIVEQARAEADGILKVAQSKIVEAMRDRQLAADELAEAHQKKLIAEKKMNEYLDIIKPAPVAAKAK